MKKIGIKVTKVVGWYYIWALLSELACPVIPDGEKTKALLGEWIVELLP